MPEYQKEPQPLSAEEIGGSHGFNIVDRINGMNRNSIEKGKKEFRKF